MHVLLNGESRQFDDIKTVAELVERLGLAGKRIAVEHNEMIVPRSRHAETELSDNDRIEIVHAIGGG
ncbi:sulfur carrier protein ThiS [Larsenimonas salina]|uniref:sulfur carrier protein ThiS n=1 Tax=Larsenimonas salina TaxID=1295565 RepID=UPI002073489C|nr:sulfur carrier protein ThiS [Larsenimonas salina]MCM5704198.1 sulfur carrier protein ThiS [Larsenimonas salina]